MGIVWLNKVSSVTFGNLPIQGVVFRTTTKVVTTAKAYGHTWLNRIPLTLTPDLRTRGAELPVTNNDPFNYTPIRLHNLSDKIIEKRYGSNSIRVTGLPNLRIESTLSHALSTSVGDVLIGK